MQIRAPLSLSHPLTPSPTDGVTSQRPVKKTQNQLRRNDRKKSVGSDRHHCHSPRARSPSSIDYAFVVPLSPPPLLVRFFVRPFGLHLHLKMSLAGRFPFLSPSSACRPFFASAEKLVRRRLRIHSRPLSLSLLDAH